MPRPTSPVTGATPTAAPQGTGNRWLGITALVYSAAVTAFESASLIGVNALAAMDSGVIARVIVSIPALLVIGIVLCVVAGAVAPRWRKLAVLGGLLMLAPIVVFVGLIFITAALPLDPTG